MSSRRALVTGAMNATNVNERSASSKVRARTVSQMTASPTAPGAARSASRAASEIAASLQARGVLATPMDRHTLRFVTHHDVSRDACVQAAGVVREVLQ